MNVQQSFTNPLDGTPEIRQDVTTGEWVIMAPARSRRPDQFVSSRAPHRHVPSFDPSCPFCPGHESQTPSPIAVIPASDDPQRWALRVIPNKFAALMPDENGQSRSVEGLFPMRPGVGYHEVIIDSPDHHGTLPHLPLGQVVLLLRAWRDRYGALRRDPGVQMISLFKNHGARSGASLAHPHTQILATPLVSASIQTRDARAQQHWRAHQRCLFCDLLRAELADGKRIVMERASVVAYQPYAARFPFETWIVPRPHQPSFADSPEAILSDLAPLLRQLVQRFVVTLHDPDYNLVLHSAMRNEAQAHSHWYLRLIPRLVHEGGFELSSGMAINPTTPEDTATLLRQADIQEFS